MWICWSAYQEVMLYFSRFINKLLNIFYFKIYMIYGFDACYFELLDMLFLEMLNDL